MEPIRVASGAGSGPTELAAYDAALVAAGAGQYNLVRLSSVIPAGATVRSVGSLPELGAAGECLRVVEAAGVGTEGAAAALAWGRRAGDGSEPGPGLFYEAAATDPGASPVSEARTGLAAGASARDWELVDRDAATAATTPADDDYAAAVVVAAYGSAGPIL